MLFLGDSKIKIKLATMFNGSARNTCTLKGQLTTARERFYLRKITNIEARISKTKAHMERFPRNDRDKAKLL